MSLNWGHNSNEKVNKKILGPCFFVTGVQVKDFFKSTKSLTENLITILTAPHRWERLIRTDGLTSIKKIETINLAMPVQ